MYSIAKKIEMKCWQAYVLKLMNNPNYFIEVGDVFLPNENTFWTRPYKYEDFGDISDKNKRVITICTMIGCYFNCQFCASRNTYTRNLTKEEIVWQIDFLIQQWKHYNRSLDPNESNEFHVLYTRMWEPAANINNVIESIYELIKRYPHVKIWMSTNGWEKWVNEFLNHPSIIPHLMMQFSLHWTDENTRSSMLWINIDDKSRLMNMHRISWFIKEFRKYNSRKVSLNIILLKGVKYDFHYLKSIFDIEDVYLRLSPLNLTQNSNSLNMEWLIKEEDVISKSPISSDELRNVIKDIETTWFSYAYAPAIDEEIKYKAACGQALEMLKTEMLSDSFYNK